MIADGVQHLNYMASLTEAKRFKVAAQGGNILILQLFEYMFIS